MVVNDIATRQVEAEQASGSKSVVAIVDRPQPVLAVNGQAQNSIEEVWLHGAARVRHGGAIDEFEKAVALRS